MSAIPPRIDFYSAADGRRLATRAWDETASPVARVVFLHGITSHGGWYEQSAEFLAGAGFEVHFLDRRGSGLNCDQSGDVDCWQTWIDDVVTFVRSGREADANSANCARRPTILCGISWGGKLAAAVARRHAGLIDAVVLICPGIYSPYLPGLAKRMALAAPAPTRLQQRRVMIPLRRAELFTDSLRWREFIEQDPFALRSVTLRTVQEDLRLTKYARAAATFLHMPVLLMLAGQDRVIDNPRTRAYFARIVGRRKTLIEYPNAAHTLEFEPDPTRYFADLAEWMGRTAAESN